MRFASKIRVVGVRKSLLLTHFIQFQQFNQFSTIVGGPTPHIEDGGSVGTTETHLCFLPEIEAALQQCFPEYFPQWERHNE